jgi:multidrug resistance efflux pump
MPGPGADRPTQALVAQAHRTTLLGEQSRLPSRTRRRIALLAVAALAGVAAWYLRDLSVSHQEPPPPPPPAIVALGKVEAVDGELAIALTMAGQLRQVFVREGEAVRCGQLLAELVNDDLAARVQAAACEVEQSRARLTLLQNGTRREEIDEATAQMEQCQALVDHYERLLVVREGLSRQQASSLDDVMTMRSQVAVNRKKLKAAQARLTALRAGPRPEEIAAAAAAVDLAKARLAELRATLERTRLRAPQNGRVLRLLRRSGESVTGEASPVLLMADLGRVQVRAEVSEKQIGRLWAGMAVEVRPRGMPDRLYRGHIERVGDLMGRKQLQGHDPREYVDVHVLEIVVALTEGTDLKLQQRVDITVPTP